MNAPRWVRAVRDRLRPAPGCPRCTGPMQYPDMPPSVEACTCVDRCESPWCNVTRTSTGSYIHTHRVQSDADKLFAELEGMPRRDRRRR